MAGLAGNIAAAGELQWRKAGPKKFKPTADSQPIATATKPAPRRDGAVRSVAFESNEPAAFDGPSFATPHSGAQQAGGSAMRSVVVEGENSAAAEEHDTVRSAQLQFQPPAEPDSRYNQQITEPFGQPQATTESTTESTEIEEMTLPPDELPENNVTPPTQEPTPPAENNRQPGNTERQPRTFQPAPTRNTPPPDPFVESDDEANSGLPNTEDSTLADEGAQSHADCTKELAALKAHTLDQVELSIAIAGKPGQDFPVECSIDEGEWYSGRCWDETTYMWKASALCHKPLYFEDEQLERYGHSWGPYCDPFVSGAHFFCTLPVLPYCMGVHPPNECMYALGHYRPGNCAPYMISPVPISCRGAVFEAGAVVGAAAILP